MKSTVTIKNIKLIVATALFLFSSCVNLKTPHRDDIKSIEAPMDIGKFPATYKKTVVMTHLNPKENREISTVIWYFFKNSPEKDSVALKTATHIALKIVDPKHIAATLYAGSTAIKTDVKKGRIKGNYFRMKHDLSLQGVPPFFWSLSSNKIQIGLSTQNQLYIDHADETNGSILIIMAGTGGFTTSLTIPPYLDK